MIQDERLDEVLIIAQALYSNADQLSQIVEAEDRPVIREKLDRAMKHLHAFFDEVESIYRKPNESEQP